MTQPPNIDVDAILRNGDKMFAEHAAAKAAGQAKLKAALDGIDKTTAQAKANLRPAYDQAMRFPKMGAGRMAAVVAGVAIAGGALYALTRKKEPKPEVGGWTSRVNAERSGPQSAFSYDR
jgi:hypothetical protein